jgi:succinoglycan biosynthesis protein ExoV
VRLFYWEPSNGPNNFGDALNTWLWPRELGAGVHDRGPWLVGIGSLLGEVRPFPTDDLKLVLGAGAGYGRVPGLDDSWRVYAVRGIHTARQLGLPAAVAATDPGVLVRRHFPWASAPRRSRVALMLHWRSANDVWQALAAELGWTYVDPMAGPDAVMAAIAGAELLVTEALHGAVVADAFRVPWVPIRTSREVLEFKWGDWCSSVGLEYAAATVLPVYSASGAENVAQGARRLIKRLVVEQQLRTAARRRPLLSTEEALVRAEGRLDAALARLREDDARGEYRGWTNQRAVTR